MTPGLLTVCRSPSIDPGKDRGRTRLERLLADLEAIPAHRREAELAEVRAEGVRVLLADFNKRQ
jgi:hypothetical protein